MQPVWSLSRYTEQLVHALRGPVAETGQHTPVAMWALIISHHQPSASLALTRLHLGIHRIC